MENLDQTNHTYDNITRNLKQLNAKKWNYIFRKLKTLNANIYAMLYINVEMWTFFSLNHFCRSFFEWLSLSPTPYIIIVR